MKADQLSKTAAFVAIKFYGLTRHEKFRSLFDDSIVNFYDKLIKQLPGPLKYYHYWLKFNWVRRLYVWSEELLLPGDLLHIIGRKWYMKQMTDKLVKDGYEQIIVLGAGFDHMGYYYSQQGINCIECDVPNMAALKRQFLADTYPPKNQPPILNLFLPRNDLKTVIENSREIDLRKRTIIVAEGFFDYLEASVVRRSLEQLKTVFLHNPVLISTHFDLTELSKVHQWVFQSSVELVGENLQFKTTMEDFNHLLSKTGFHINEIYNSEQIRSEICKKSNTNLPILKGFYIFSAK